MDPFPNSFKTRETVTILSKYSFIRWKIGGRAFTIHSLIRHWAAVKIEDNADIRTIMKTSVIGVVSSNLAQQDLLPPMALPSVRFIVGEDRSLRLWPWRVYSNLIKYALRCFTYVTELDDMNEIVTIRILALLQVLDCTTLGLVEWKRSIAQKPLESAISVIGTLEVSIVWEGLFGIEDHQFGSCCCR